MRRGFAGEDVDIPLRLSANMFCSPKKFLFSLNSQAVEESFLRYDYVTVSKSLEIHEALLLAPTL